jgi:hypothetical protein
VCSGGKKSGWRSPLAQFGSERVDAGHAATGEPVHKQPSVVFPAHDGALIRVQVRLRFPSRGPAYPWTNPTLERFWRTHKHGTTDRSQAADIEVTRSLLLLRVDVRHGAQQIGLEGTAAITEMTDRQKRRF